MSDHTTLTDTERATLAVWWDSDWPSDGADVLDTLAATVESIVAARVAAARAERDAEWTAKARDIIATPDDEQWWPVQPYTDPSNDDEVVEVQVIDVGRLRALIEGADHG